MLLNSRRPRLLRALASVLAVVQFVSVTWVPLVHPTIHPDRTFKTPLAGIDSPTTGSEDLVMGENMCVACMVSPNALPSPYRFLPAAESGRKQPLVRQQVKWYPFKSFIPSNPSRAPPTI